MSKPKLLDLRLVECTWPKPANEAFERFCNVGRGHACRGFVFEDPQGDTLLVPVAGGFQFVRLNMFSGVKELGVAKAPARLIKRAAILAGQNAAVSKELTPLVGGFNWWEER
ncbi:MAG: hypothetical protein A3I39_00965 [Candidatus Yanofskybacteria bacterium RIFCSPLOWO2_02_FULL_47_9b]|uniref:Uncharacterized protein n=1 Tax=Candidatus Yanofskybacteria bacterium RIFCSPLOWO2_02_FULL_47_9b TaxID=1802708 RepID=A0A1F8H7W9_9BACT|nr:MAG: hypothetical protein A3I39_00965 [Candidatus Yanofskybacteria bacterium RIFCSPLOWO2_02_FULL_47_9b]